MNWHVSTKQLAAAYDSGAYGACAYQTGCATSGPGASTGGTVGAPDTGFLAQLTQPYIAIPVILVGAVLIASLILATKKLIRRTK